MEYCTSNNLVFVRFVDVKRDNLGYMQFLCVISWYYQLITHQGGRTWLAFGGGKNGHETFRQAHIYNFRDKCVVFARNLKFSNLTQ